VEADLEREFGVWSAAQIELHNRRGAAWPTLPYDPTGRWATIQRHLLTHDRERAFVAEDADRIAGFTAAMVRDGCWFLSALFVAPEYQGRGIGRHLLELTWGGPYRRRVTITEAIQPVSTGLYAQRGLLPVTPVLRFTGEPHAASTAVLDPVASDPSALLTIDAAAYGFDRRVDHELWTRISGHATVWSRQGEPIAYSYRGPDALGPVAGKDPASAGQALQHLLASCAGERVQVSIPGTATALVRAAIAAGLRLEDPGLLLISPSNLPPPDALAIHSYWLM
jgi:GNAT superfamily N-acetyltransferase